MRPGSRDHCMWLYLPFRTTNLLSLWRLSFCCCSVIDCLAPTFMTGVQGKLSIQYLRLFAGDRPPHSLRPQCNLLVPMNRSIFARSSRFENRESRVVWTGCCSLQYYRLSRAFGKETKEKYMHARNLSENHIFHDLWSFRRPLRYPLVCLSLFAFDTMSVVNYWTITYASMGKPSKQIFESHRTPALRHTYTSPSQPSVAHIAKPWPRPSGNRRSEI